MGSKYIDAYHLDPKLVNEVLRGDRPEIFDAILGSDDPPEAEQAAVLELLRGYLFPFFSSAEHPDGIHFSRAIERVFKALSSEDQRCCFEFSLDETNPFYDFCFSRGEAAWFNVPSSPYGVGVWTYRDAQHCRWLANSLSGSGLYGEEEANLYASFLNSASYSDNGLFLIYQA